MGRLYQYLLSLRDHLKALLLAIIAITTFTWLSGSLNGQDAVQGYVIDSISQQPLTFVNVIVQSGRDQKIVAFDLTDEFGHFSIVLDSSYFPLHLQASMLGYNPKSIPMASKDDLYDPTFLLTLQANQLEEIQIKAFKRGIVINGDTVTYDKATFTHGEEKTIEEVLNKLPGLHVDKNGTISANGQNISTVLIDGDDFLNENRKAILKGISAQDIAKISVIENYQSNRNTQDDWSSTALNIQLKSELSHEVRGRVEVMLGPKGKYLLKANPYSLKGNSKFYINASSANTGQNRLNIADYLLLNSGSLESGQSVPQVFLDRTDYSKLASHYLSGNFSIRPNNFIKHQGFLYFYKANTAIDRLSTQISETEAFQLTSQDDNRLSLPLLGANMLTQIDIDDQSLLQISLKATLEKNNASSYSELSTNGRTQLTEQQEIRSHYKIDFKTEYHNNFAEHSRFQIMGSININSDKDSLHLQGFQNQLPVASFFQRDVTFLTQNTNTKRKQVNLSLLLQHWDSQWELNTEAIFQLSSADLSLNLSTLDHHPNLQHYDIQRHLLKEKIVFNLDKVQTILSLPLQYTVSRSSTDHKKAFLLEPSFLIEYRVNPLMKITFDYTKKWGTWNVAQLVGLPTIRNANTISLMEFDPLDNLSTESIRIKFRNQNKETGFFVQTHLRYSTRESSVINNRYSLEYQLVGGNRFNFQKSWDGAVFFAKHLYKSAIGLRGYAYYRAFNKPKQLNNATDYNELTESLYGQATLFSNWEQHFNIEYNVNYNYVSFNALSSDFGGYDLSNSLTLLLNKGSFLRDFRLGLEITLQDQNSIRNNIFNIFGNIEVQPSPDAPVRINITYNNILNLNSVQSVTSQWRDNRFYSSQSSRLPGFVMLGITYDLANSNDK